VTAPPDALAHRRSTPARIAAALRPVGALMLFAVVIASVLALVLLTLGASPVAVFADLWQGAFGDWLAFTDTLVKSTPLIFTGLAVAVAFQGALWNIGAEGQLLIGALAAGAYMALIAEGIGVPCMAAWALFGSSLRHVIGTPQGRRVFNVAMALALATTAVMMVR